MIEFMSLIAQVLIGVFGLIFLLAIVLALGELRSSSDRITRHDDF